MNDSPASDAGIITEHFIFAVSDKPNPTSEEWVLLHEESCLATALEQFIPNTDKPFLNRFNKTTASANRDAETFTVYLLAFVGLGEGKAINDYQTIPITLTKRRAFVDQYGDQNQIENFMANTYNNAD